MSKQNNPLSHNEQPNWGPNAPKGGRAVVTRALKEGATVPLFLGQTFLQSLRDVGYNSTTSAICEHVDNAIQADASEVRVYFNQTGRRGSFDVDVMIYDDGVGMPPHVLQVAMAFGGSMNFENRSGIGRFGVGMKTAALSLGPTLDLYSWQEDEAIYGMTMDVNEIGADRSNLIVLPEPSFRTALPNQISEIMTKHMIYPDSMKQDLVANNVEDLSAKLGAHGTVIFIPNCDRLTHKQAKTLTDHATREMSRIYRRQIGEGLNLYVNNRRVEAFDPTYWMPNARHTNIDGVPPARSRLVESWPEIMIPIQEGGKEMAPASVRLYRLPMEEWYDLPRKVQTNLLQLFEDYLVSFMRNDREVHVGAVKELSGMRHADSIWMRIQVDFDGRLDEAFGVAMNKQGVRPKKYALNIIRDHIKNEVSKVREQTAQFRAEKSSKGTPATLTDAERRAKEAEAFQGKQLLSPNPQTDEEKAVLEANLRSLAVTLKRDEETDEQAYTRIKSSTYITTFRHDQLWPFYNVDFQSGKIILTINTAHPFFIKLYEPLTKLAALTSQGDEDINDFDETVRGNGDYGELLTALRMLLFSLGRAQAQMTSGSEIEENKKLFETLQVEWSQILKRQLTAA